jgi:two-component system, chemotaxis family, CheB/CheR fusion protein
MISQLSHRHFTHTHDVSPVRHIQEKTPSLGAEGADGFQRVMTALKTHAGVDFSQYRDTTFKRRTARRMPAARLHLGAAVCPVPRRRSRGDRRPLSRRPDQRHLFFCDPEMFGALKRDVFPGLLNGKANGAPIRVWVPGCSTGQEA